MDLDAIELTESITGEAILPRDVDDADHQPGEVAARLAREEAIRKAAEDIDRELLKAHEVYRTDEDGFDTPWHRFIADHIARALADGGLLVTPQHDADERATALEERARWIRGGSRETYARDELADWLEASARRYRQIGGAS